MAKPRTNRGPFVKYLDATPLSSRIKSTMTVILLVTLYIFHGSGCSARHTGPPATESDGMRPMPLKYIPIERLLKTMENVSYISILSFQRDSTGTTLFIKFSIGDPNDKNYHTAIVKKTGVITVTGFAPWFDDMGHPVFRFTNGDCIFNSGVSIPIKAPDMPDRLQVIGISGDDLVMIHFPGDGKWIIAKTHEPRVPLLQLPAGLAPELGYATTNEVIVFGTYRRPGKFVTKCLIYRRTSAGYALPEEISLPWADIVYDMDATSGDALITGNPGFVRRYYLFNIRDRRKRDLGSDPGQSLFLKKEVIQALEAAFHNSKSK
jgi:hypothetical protein